MCSIFTYCVTVYMHACNYAHVLDNMFALAGREGEMEYVTGRRKREEKRGVFGALYTQVSDLNEKFR